MSGEDAGALAKADRPDEPDRTDRTGWEFWIDRGGTFTDCIGVDPQGLVRTTKILSSDTAPIEGVRALLRAAGALGEGAAIPRCSVKLGSTVATNALLERRGVETVLVANRGLADVFVIGTQQRPELFDLAIERPAPLHAEAIEVAGRIDARGRPVEGLDREGLRAALVAAHGRGMRSVAIALMHSYLDPGLEEECAAIARACGFEFVVPSHEIAREQGLLARGETAAADAYLTPLLRRHTNALARGLEGSRLRFMQSSGGLTDSSRFRGPSALLSGPAGGVVAAAAVARAAGHDRAVAFDMGGTSTDVSLVIDGQVERAFETEVGGVRVKAPMLRIHTVAAGGGSLCRFDGFRLTVGPESAGAEPGPLCYGLRDASGERLATELALSDANAALGRVQPDRFPFALDREAVADAFSALEHDVRSAGFERSSDELAAGFLEVANASMAQAIAQVSVARGIDPRACALVAFGGAAGQHACQVARVLGIRTVLLHPLAGLLSAYGIGCASVSWDGQRDAGRVALEGSALPEEVQTALVTLEGEGRAALLVEGFDAAQITSEAILDLRYQGTDTALPVRSPDSAASAASPDARFPGPVPGGATAAAAPGLWRAAFEREHRARFGYLRPGRPIEIVTSRVRASAESPAPVLVSPAVTQAGADTPDPLRRERVWFAEVGWSEVPVYEREALAPGHELRGPALVLEGTGTIALDPGFSATVGDEGLLVLEDLDAGHAALEPALAAEDDGPADPVRLEVFGNRFMSIAEQMGAVLRNTAVSTNIKERLDYSCAVFDPDGGLVANAPHIPVHLGAMGETVRCVRARFPELAPGDVVATNDPFQGGSHLPDVTVVTPVFLGEGDGEGRGAGPDFYVASRGHHADIGGISPGSMPPDSVTLDDEGVLLEPFLVVHSGEFDEAELRRRLETARYPARRPDDNVADTQAMIAANAAGATLLLAFVAEQGAPRVQRTMRELQTAAAAKVAREIAAIPDGEHRFADALDDGSEICVTLRVRGEHMTIDFSGTAAAQPGNLNAPRAVVQAAVIYVLRCLVSERIPLNGGCLQPVEIRIPEGSLLDPPAGAAVVGGNVETSQRVVDVLLGALGVAAASQGTMNNVTFGDDTFGYYETIGGGAGAGPGFHGASGVHTHMTNTRITDPEVLEARYPVRLDTFALRPGSGGQGRFRGGDGLIRSYIFTAPVTAAVLTQRRERAPFGLSGGAAGARGRNRVERSDGRVEDLGPQNGVRLESGDRLVVETPGGGGFGRPEG